MYQNVVKSYQQTQIFTTNPSKLVLMCYEGAISSLKLARENYMAGQFKAKAKALQKCMDIIYELNTSLDLEKGGEFAVNLRGLYLYMAQALTEADLKRDIGTMDRVITMLEELESAWKTSVTPIGYAGAGGPRREIPGGVRPVAVERAWSV
jgi:flagellar protein FliS